MQIYVKSLTGSTTTLEFNPTDIVECISNKIQDKEGILPNKQYIYFADQLLIGSKTLSDYEIHDKAILHLTYLIDVIVRLSGNETKFFSRNSNFTIRTELQSTILELKNKIQTQTGIQTSKQKLFFDGEMLDNSKTIGYYHIKDNSILDLDRF